MAENPGKTPAGADAQRQGIAMCIKQKQMCAAWQQKRNETGKKEHFRHNSKSFIHIFVDIFGKVRIIQPVWLRRMIV